MEHESDEYAHEHNYEHHETDVNLEFTYSGTPEDPQQPDPTNQQPPPQQQQPGQTRFGQPQPAYATPPAYANNKPPKNYPPQAAPVQFPPQPAAPVQFPPQPSPQQQGYSTTPQGVQMNQMNGAPTPGYVMPQSPYQGANYPKNEGTVGWSTGLFDCMDDPTNALLTACCPCFTFGQIAEIIDRGNTTCGTSGIIYGVIAALIAVPCLISCTYRTKLRNQYDLVEVPAADWLTHCFCEWCALCQEYRELKNRGLDPALGWHGNLLRQQQQQQHGAMMPPQNQTMGMGGPGFGK